MPPSVRVTFRALEGSQVEEIWRRQNGECRHDLSGALDHDPPWAPMSLEQVRSKLEERGKKERAALLTVWSSEESFVGVGAYDADWDPACPHLLLLIWPEYRRRGYGTAAARLLLESCFRETLAHVVGAYVPDFSREGLAFAESLGFQRAGVERRAGMKDGRFFDGVFLDLLRREYEGHRESRKGA